MSRSAILTILLTILAGPLWADIVEPRRTIRAGTLIADTDLALRPGNAPGAIAAIVDAVGKEARVTLYRGRPIRPAEIGPPALIRRNQIVDLIYRRGGLRISVDGRALGRGIIGERLKVMNLASRGTLIGLVLPDGTVEMR